MPNVYNDRFLVKYGGFKITQRKTVEIPTNRSHLERERERVRRLTVERIRDDIGQICE